MKPYRPRTLMIKRQAAGLLAVLMTLFSAQTYALDLLCSKQKQNASYSLASAAEEPEDEFELANGFSLADLTLDDLFQVFQSGRGAKSNERVLLCVFPENHVATRELFSELGLGTKAAETLYHARQNTDRKVKVVASEADMSACVASAYPSIGYVAHNTTSQQSQGCY